MNTDIFFSYLYIAGLRNSQKERIKTNNHKQRTAVGHVTKQNPLVNNKFKFLIASGLDLHFKNNDVG